VFVVVRFFYSSHNHLTHIVARQQTKDTLTMTCSPISGPRIAGKF
jgi:hypothetical protein